MRRIDFEADLSLEQGNSLMQIRSLGDTIVIDSADFVLPIVLLRQLRSTFASPRLRQLGESLHAAGVTVELRHAGQITAKLGFKAHNRWLGMLGIPHTEVHSLKLAWKMLSNRASRR